MNQSFSTIGILSTPTSKSSKVLALIPIQTNDIEIVGSDAWLIDEPVICSTHPNTK